MHAMRPLLASLIVCAMCAAGDVTAQTATTPPPATAPITTPPATPLPKRAVPLPATQNSSELQRQQQNSRDRAQSMAEENMQKNRRQSADQSEQDAPTVNDASHYPTSTNSTH